MIKNKKNTLCYINKMKMQCMKTFNAQLRYRGYTNTKYKFFN